MSTNAPARKPHAVPAALLMTTIAIALATMVTTRAQQTPPPPATSPQGPQGTFRFRSGVELINVTATVADASGRFVPGLSQSDFAVYEDDQPVQVTHFSAERVPVSLGIAIDTSGSMAGAKIQEAQSALDRCSTSRTKSSSIASAIRRSCCRNGRRIGSCCRGRWDGCTRTAALRCTIACRKPFRWRSADGIRRNRCSSSRTATTRRATRASTI